MVYQLESITVRVPGKPLLHFFMVWEKEGTAEVFWGGAGRERVWGLCWDGAGAGGIGCGYGYGYGYGYGGGYFCPSVQGI